MNRQIAEKVGCASHVAQKRACLDGRTCVAGRSTQRRRKSNGVCA